MVKRAPWDELGSRYTLQTDGKLDLSFVVGTFHYKMFKFQEIWVKTYLTSAKATGRSARAQKKVMGKEQEKRYVFVSSRYLMLMPQGSNCLEVGPNVYYIPSKEVFDSVAAIS